MDGQYLLTPLRAHASLYELGDDKTQTYIAGRVKDGVANSQSSLIQNDTNRYLTKQHPITNSLNIILNIHTPQTTHQHLLGVNLSLEVLQFFYRANL